MSLFHEIQSKSRTLLFKSYCAHHQSMNPPPKASPRKSFVAQPTTHHHLFSFTAALKPILLSVSAALLPTDQPASQSHVESTVLSQWQVSYTDIEWGKRGEY